MKLSRDNKAKLNITFTMLALAMIALATATYAWFSLSLSTKVNTIDLEVTAGMHLKISTVDHGNNMDKYDSIVENGPIETQIGYALNTVKLAPLTSSDGVKLYDQQKNLVENKSTSKRFLQFDLFFIGSTAMDVYLTEAPSKVGADDGTAVTTTETGNKAKIAQCVRISFEPDGGGGKIYEPNKNGSTTLSILGAGTQNTFTDAKINDNSSKLLSLAAETPEKVTVRIWIEGDDEPDCNDDVIKATFATQLRFEGVE